MAVNQTYLCDPRLDPVLYSIDQLDRKMLSYLSQIGDGFMLMPRAGANILPFCNDILPTIDTCMPKYDPLFNKTWQDITDQRAHQVEQLAMQGKQIVVFWSGGIDSTCMLTAILKNFSKSNLSQVTVAHTWQSVAENPNFYHDLILPNLKVIDTNHFVQNVMPYDTNTIILEGFAADTLLMSMHPSLDVNMAVRHPEQLTCDWRKSDQLITYLQKITGSSEFATWYYEKNRASIESIDVPIQTYFDFMWWFGFNCEYASWALNAWFFCYRNANMTYNEYKSRCVGWFRTDDYQLWAMKNTGPNVKHGKDLGSFKKHPKQYIYDFDKNSYYWKYKTKVDSAGRKFNTMHDKPFAITDSFKILYLEKDLPQILSLLPTHIRS
jgi:hypothetical protein